VVDFIAKDNDDCLDILFNNAGFGQPGALEDLSKYALEGLSDTFRQELEPFGVKVVLIEPGPIRSDFRKNAYENFKKQIKTEGSFYEKEYKKAVERFESSGDDPFTLGSDAVYDVLLKIINSKNPRPRYRVTFPTKLFWFLKRVLSTKMLDRILKNV